MYFVGLGLILVVMKYMVYGPVADWPWLLVLSPFAGAMAWWSFADRSGLTAKRAMQHEQQRRQERIDRNRANMGITGKRDRK